MDATLLAQQQEVALIDGALLLAALDSIAYLGAGSPAYARIRNRVETRLIALIKELDA